MTKFQVDNTMTDTQSNGITQHAICRSIILSGTIELDKIEEEDIFNHLISFSEKQHKNINYIYFHSQVIM